MVLRHLLIDDGEIENIVCMTRVVNQPVKHPDNPLIRCEHPWEMLGIQTYGTVIHDREDGLFKIWYLTHAGPFADRVRVEGIERLANMTLLAYATSKDGIHWEKPDLGQIYFEGSTKNNLVGIGRLNIEGASILLEPDEIEATRRYKAFYWEHGSGKMIKTGDGTYLWGKGEGDGMWVSFSPDGINWNNHPSNPVIDLDSDTGQSVVWDPGIERYVAYGRFGAGGRKVARSESPDFIHWSDPRLVLEPDGEDGPNTQFYGISVTIYQGIYVGLLWVFHIEPKGHLGGGKDVGSIDIQLVSSRDGISWNRVANRQVFIPTGPNGAWDSRIIQASCRFITLEDEHLIYYNGSARKHGQGGRTGNSQIGLVTIRRDGFVSIDAEEKVGQLITRPFTKPPGDLHINIDSSRGRMTCHLLNPDGTSLLGPSKPVKTDSMDHIVEWPADPSQLDGMKIKLLLRARRTKLFSYWFE